MYVCNQAQTISSCALLLFRCHDLDLEPMTLKLNHDLDILKMYLQTENEVARSSHSKYIARIEKYENSSQGQRSRSNVTNQLPATSSVHHDAYFYQITSIADL